MSLARRRLGIGRDIASKLSEVSESIPTPAVHHIRLHHPRISGVHADITVDQSCRFVLRDHSRFGISADGQRVQKIEAHILKESATHRSLQQLSRSNRLASGSAISHRGQHAALLA